MTDPKITVHTYTYNKPRHFREAADALLAQTRTDWQWLVVLDGPTPELLASVRTLPDLPQITILLQNTRDDHRKQFARPCELANDLWPICPTPYLAWLSDDDVWASTYLEDLAGGLDDNPHWGCSYGPTEVMVEISEGEYQLNTMIPAEYTYGPGSKAPCFRLDGGQVLYRADAVKDAFAKGWRFPTVRDERAECNFADGLFLNRLCDLGYKLHPVNKRTVMRKRCTELSEYNKGR